MGRCYLIGTATNPPQELVDVDATAAIRVSSREQRVDGIVTDVRRR